MVSLHVLYQKIAISGSYVPTPALEVLQLVVLLLKLWVICLPGRKGAKMSMVFRRFQEKQSPLPRKSNSSL